MPRFLIPLLFAAALLGGCASTAHSPDFTVPPGRYADAFEAVRDTLDAERFQVDRVDAAEGVITSTHKTTAGLATPWDDEQQTFGQEWEDLINDQDREVRITFEPVTPPPPGDQPLDLRRFDGPITAHVDVVINRTQHTGWRLETTGLRFSSYTQDPALTERGMWPSYSVPFSEDPLLAGRLAGLISKKLAAGAPTAPAATPTAPMPANSR